MFTPNVFEKNERGRERKGENGTGPELLGVNEWLPFERQKDRHMPQKKEKLSAFLRLNVYNRRK